MRLNSLVIIAEFECESLYFVRGSSIHEIREIDSTKKDTVLYGKSSGVEKIAKH